MNPLNYASLEASQRLVEAGIVMETEHYWMHYIKESYLTHFHCEKTEYPFFKTPAPSMAEVWRELPEGTTLQKWALGYQAWIAPDYEKYHSQNTNPTDALIDLLVWIKGHKGE